MGTWDGGSSRGRGHGQNPLAPRRTGRVIGAPTVMDGVVYFSNSALRRGAPRRVELGANSTFALDARTGKRLWTFPDGRYSPIVADSQRLYLVGRTRVYGLEGKRAQTAKR